MKSLLIIRTRVRAMQEALKDDDAPRARMLEQALEADVLDATMLQSAPAWRRWVYRLLPDETYAQALEAAFIAHRYDVVVSWGERYATLYGFLKLFTRNRTPHVALLYWMSKPNVARPLHIVRNAITQIVTWTSVQRDFAIRELGFTPEQITLVRHPVDQLFWRPLAESDDMISSAGSENRDYRTLIEAMRGLPIACRIASGETRLISHASSSETNTAEMVGAVPENVIVRPCVPKELRTIYARSRFVVVPLFPTETDNGVTVILEAMAMGKTVICSRVHGQVDVIQEGKTGLYVPQGNVAALRDAITALWNDPAKAHALGEAGRRYIEEFHTLDRFVGQVRDIVNDVIRRNQE